ncbi:hypothetical protein [Kitasatospora sp. NRRL B-11411]|uniref:hypothetical protein n=1 Tax=Kitasatospora sp. NRRL B-11411 TaxID=1463822 RepID=UPI0012FEFC2A|nr:hypothetical protein [Kitasatospora sp. NRRL B-11411]
MSNNGHQFIANTITVNYHNHSSGEGSGAIGPAEPAASAAAAPPAPPAGGQNAAGPTGDPSPVGGGDGRTFHQNLFVFLLVIVIGLAITLFLSPSLVASLLLVIAGLAAAWAKIKAKE